MIPRGIRNKNPGNLRPSSPPWNGTIGADGGFAVFDTLANGIRALCKQLMVYQKRDGIYTIPGIIQKWAPPSDHNDTAAYIAMVCNMLECTTTDRFRFNDPDFLYWMVVAIGSVENGPKEFAAHCPDADIEAGIAAALT